MSNMQEWIAVFLKGTAMGAANVIPGVSGGTVAFITGIYERLINALKSFDAKAFLCIKRGDLGGFARHVDLVFLLVLGLGTGVSVFTFAKVLKWAFSHHETLVWAFFFGLIAASIPAVGRMVRHWRVSIVMLALLGAAIAVSMVFFGRAEQNSHFAYLVLCGVVAICSMIVPGLSGSFVLLLLGNYELVMVDSVNLLRTDPLEAFPILVPVGLGAVVGLVAFSRVLSWLFKNYHDLAVSLITGFIAGSLAIIWPWKQAVVETFAAADGGVKGKVAGFTNWHWPDLAAPSSWVALGFMAAGAILVLLMERWAPAAVTRQESSDL